MMHRNSQWEDEAIDLENQITHLLKKIEAVKNYITGIRGRRIVTGNDINEIQRILEIEQ